MFTHQIVRDHGLLLSGRVVEMAMPSQSPRGGTYCGDCKGDGGKPNLSFPPCDVVAAVVILLPDLRLLS